MLTKRQFLVGGGVLLSSVAATGIYATFVEPYWLDVVRRSFRFRNSPGLGRPMRVAQISDLHICDRIDLEYLRSAFREVENEKPDVVVYTGDFITLVSGWREGLSSLLPKFPKGTRGTLAVLGNHDYGSGFTDAKFASELVTQVETFGIRVLRNESLLIDGLRFVGLDDLWAGRFDSKLVSEKNSAGLPTIVLAHNPDAFDLPDFEKFTGLVLSGHTHGGQCRPPFLPPPLLPVRNRRYTEGMFENGSGASIYVNRGVGFLLKARFNVRPEVTIFDLS